MPWEMSFATGQASARGLLQIIQLLGCWWCSVPAGEPARPFRQRQATASPPAAGAGRAPAAPERDRLQPQLLLPALGLQRLEAGGA